MAQLNIKQCTFKLVDGRRGTLTIGAGSAGLIYTAVSRHNGTRGDLKVAHVTSGTNTALSVVVTTTNGVRLITVNLATNGGGVATSTAAQVKTAVDASVSAAALVTTAFVTDGTGTAVAAAAAGVTTLGARAITLKVGTGTVNYSESEQVDYTLDRGNIDTVKTGDEQEMSVDVDMTWIEFTASTGSGTPSAPDAIMQVGEAAAWASTSDDPSGCSPYCVDIEVTYDPGSCGNELKEIYVFEEFYWADLNPTWKDGTIKFSGKCNRKVPSIYRVA